MYVLYRLIIILSLIGVVLFLITEDSRASVYTSGMVGVANSGKTGLSETKFLNIGRRVKLGDYLLQQVEVGGWADRAGQGRKSSGYGAYQVGAEAGDSAVARVMFGPAAITTTDTLLGGHFQFTEDFFIGIKGDNGNIIGMKYKHFSSAGLSSPNVGRDLLGVELSIPL